MSFDWKGTLGKVVPGIANMLGGPLAGMATSAVCEFFGLDPGEEDVEQKIQKAVQNMSPEQAIELKKIEANLHTKLKEIQVDIFEAEVDDRKSARTQHKNSITPALITYLLIGCAGYIVYAIMSGNIPVDVDKTLVGTVIGYVFAEVKQATGFWLGTSFQNSGANTSPGPVDLMKKTFQRKLK